MTLPNSGSMQNGHCTQQPTLVPHTNANDSGSWPTPTGMDNRKSGGNPNGTGTHGETLTDATVHQWPTPQSRDYRNDTNSQGQTDRHSPNLPNISRQWATPRASMNENRTTRHAPTHGVTHGITLAGQASHQPLTTPTGGPNGSRKVDLNPFFVATLMGLPADWLTHSTSQVTASSHNALQKQSDNSSTEPTGPSTHKDTQ